MKFRHTIRAVCLPLAIAAGMASLPAAAAVNFDVRIAPPAPQVEVVPSMAPGYVWAPGYWGWHGDRYVWVHGRSIYQRSGYRWAPDRWEQRNGRYYRHEGGWERDRDGRRDHRP